MQIVARPPVGGTARYLARASRPKLSWIRSAPGAAPLAEDTDGPTVVVVDERGEIVIQRPGTFGQARRAAARFRRELDSVGPTEFARRYGLHFK